MSDLYPVKPHVAERAHINSMAEYERLYRLSLDNPEWFWAEQAKAIDWFHPWQNVFDADYDEVDFAWFSGGRLNASFNCVDRHLGERGDRTAIIWAQDEVGAYRHISYRELKHNVGRVANVLLAHGVRRGDRVVRLHGHDARARLHHARLRPHRGGALGGVRRLQRGVPARPDRRRALQDRGHRQRGAARRKAHSAQEDRRSGHRRDVAGGDGARRPAHRDARSPCSRVATTGSTRSATSSARPAPPSGWGRRTRSSSSTRPGARASPRGCCTPPAATSSTPPTPTRWCSTTTPATSTSARPTWAGSRPQLHRLRAPGQRRHHRAVRVDPDLSRPRPVLADRRRPRGGHLLHRPHRAPGPGPGRGRVGEALQPQVAPRPGDGRGADQPRDLALVPRRRWETSAARWSTPGGRRRRAESSSHPCPGSPRPSRARPPCPSSACSRWSWTRTTERSSRATASAGRCAWRRRGLARRARSGAITSASRRRTSRQYPGYYFTGDGCPARRGRLLLDHRPHRRRPQRLRSPSGHGRGGERARGPRGGGGGGGRGLPPPDQGAGDLRLRQPDPRVPEPGPGAGEGRAQGAGPPRRSGPSPRPTSSTSPPGCPRPAAARSCGGS